MRSGSVEAFFPSCLVCGTEEGLSWLIVGPDSKLVAAGIAPGVYCSECARERGAYESLEEASE
jgi:hypothetical protein